MLDLASGEEEEGEWAVTHLSDDILPLCLQEEDCDLRASSSLPGFAVALDGTFCLFCALVSTFAL